MEFSPQIEFFFPTGLLSFKDILSKFQYLYFGTSLINFSDHCLKAPASYYFSNFFLLYIYIFIYYFIFIILLFLFFVRDPKMGYNMYVYKLLFIFRNSWCELSTRQRVDIVRTIRVAHTAPKQKQVLLYRVAFTAPCHLRHSGEAHVWRQLIKELRSGVLPSFPLSF